MGIKGVPGNRGDSGEQGFTGFPGVKVINFNGLCYCHYITIKCILFFYRGSKMNYGGGGCFWSWLCMHKIRVISFLL